MVGRRPGGTYAPQGGGTAPSWTASKPWPATSAAGPRPAAPPAIRCPSTALDAADGLTDAPTARLMALYRAERAAAIRPTLPATGTPNPTL